MRTVTARATALVTAPPEQVLELLRDLEQRPRFLTENYTAFRVEPGPSSSDPVIAYHFAAGGRERDYRLRVERTSDGLRERDELSSFVSTWTVVPSGADSSVTLESSWQGASGIGGIFEGLFAPLGLKRIYGQVLERLAAVAASPS
jgi:uncharacterized protein YndB with AHSA1/START domain